MSSRLYASTDASPPVLTGQVASLNNLLLAVLVNGYGSQPAAGWTSPYSNAGTNERVFMTAGANPGYLLVQDHGQSAGGAKEARIKGYENMSAYNVGTGLFPSAAQRANGYCVRKSASADATPRAWTILADEHRFYLMIDTGDTNCYANLTQFGRFKSYKDGDLYNFQISGRSYENSTNFSAAYDPPHSRSPAINSVTQLHLMRSYTGVGGSTAGGMTTDSAKANITNERNAGSSGMAYPMPVDGGLYLSKTYINEANILRGELPAIWCPLHDRPINHTDTFTGVEGLSGKTFQCLWLSGTGSIFIETSDTWDL